MQDQINDMTTQVEENRKVFAIRSVMKDQVTMLENLQWNKNPSIIEGVQKLEAFEIEPIFGPINDPAVNQIAE